MDGAASAEGGEYDDDAGAGASAVAGAGDIDDDDDEDDDDDDDSDAVEGEASGKTVDTDREGGEDVGLGAPFFLDGALCWTSGKSVMIRRCTDTRMTLSCTAPYLRHPRDAKTPQSVWGFCGSIYCRTSIAVFYRTRQSWPSCRPDEDRPLSCGSTRKNK